MSGWTNKSDPAYPLQNGAQSFQLIRAGCKAAALGHQATDQARRGNVKRGVQRQASRGCQSHFPCIALAIPTADTQHLGPVTLLNRNAFPTGTGPVDSG